MPEPREVWCLETQHVGRRILVFDSLPSTNDTAAQLASAPGHAGTVVVAEHQTAGRGQYGRVWHSRPGTALLMSVLLAPPEELRRPVVLTAWAAVSVAEAIHTLTGVRTRLKWPNDLLLDGKKVCGILIEQGIGTVVGIGLNLNHATEDFAAALLPDATSLALVGGMPFDLRTALSVVVRQLDAEYDRLMRGELAPLQAAWSGRLGLLGRDVVAQLADGSTIAGRLRELSFDGIEMEANDGGIRVLRPEVVRQLTAY